MLFCSTWIISADRIHLYLALLFHRDYFAPVRFISIWLFCATGIISTDRIHPQLAFFFRRDYFHWPDSSLTSSFVPQGLLCPSQIHLYLALLFHRDYFGHPDSSLTSSFVPQGLFRPPGFISSLLFCSTGIISADRIHLYLAFLFHKDYFGHPDSSLTSSFVPQGLFRPPGFISSFLFCSTGIISATRIHLYLAFLYRRDYFDRPNSSHR